MAPPQSHRNRIDADCYTYVPAEVCCDTRDMLYLFERLEVDLSNAALDGESEFVDALARTGKNDPIRLTPGRQVSNENLAPEANFQARACIDKDPGDVRIGVGLYRVVDLREPGNGLGKLLIGVAHQAHCRRRKAGCRKSGRVR